MVSPLDIDSSRPTIVAISTAPGIGGIAVIRLSGSDAIGIASKVWRGRHLADLKGGTATFGRIVNDEGEIIDEAVATIFRAPHSFTGEDTVEFSVHGSGWIQQEVVNLLCSNGARAANRGEFTQRAFMNGKLDLAQAESVGDLIAASSRSAHRLAMTQLKGDYSRRLEELRGKLIEIASLLELELDFSEEDVEFADRRQLRNLAEEILTEVTRLADSFRHGKVFKEGIPVVIGGLPNAGKSTLLNALAEDEKAIVTDIPGTTRDLIEERVEIDGILFRFIDTAGLRHTDDTVERIGVERSRKAISECRILLWLDDPTQSQTLQDKEFTDVATVLPHDTAIIRLTTKSDLQADSAPEAVNHEINTNTAQVLKNNEGEENTINRIKNLVISAKTGLGIKELQHELHRLATAGIDTKNEIIVTNARHHESLLAAADSLRRVLDGLSTLLSGDLIAQDLRETLHHLSAITGQITTDNLLQTIFSRFCIGK